MYNMITYMTMDQGPGTIVTAEFIIYTAMIHQPIKPPVYASTENFHILTLN